MDRPANSTFAFLMRSAALRLAVDRIGRIRRPRALLQDFGLASAGIANLSARLLMWNGTVAPRRYAGVAAGVILKNVAVGTAALSSGCVSISNITD
jgi:hypothetical protein